MALILTPSQLVKRAEFYHQLHQLLTAGIGLLPALEQLHRNPPSRSFRPPLRGLINQLIQGASFAEALHQSNNWLPAFDVALLDAGERSGRLPNCCRLLSIYYNSRARLVRGFITPLIYPVFMLHFAALIFPVDTLTRLVWKGETTAYVLQKAMLLLPLYAMVLAGIVLLQGSRSETWRAALEAILHPIPLLGTARRSLALSRLSAALEALINAGVLMVEAWELAAAASGSPALRRVVAHAKPRLLAGMPPSEMISGSRHFPEMFKNFYSGGELSGQLDQTLGRMSAYYEDEGTRQLQWFMRLAAGAITAIIMGLVVWQIISFYAGYFRQIGDVM